MRNLDIPEPFKSEEFVLFQERISDNPSIDVYINEQRDFAFLHPTPEIDYSNYVPRVKKYGFTEYKKNLDLIERRFRKIQHLLKYGTHSLLEIGAGDGAFLQTIRQHLPEIQLTAVDKDQNTLQLRLERSDKNYDSIEEIQVISDPFSPEYGSAYGGIINMVTKSGSNDFSGNFSLVLQNKNLQAERQDQLAVVSEADKFSNTNWYLNLGGPIIKDRLWFFISNNLFADTPVFVGKFLGNLNGFIIFSLGLHIARFLRNPFF